MKLEDGLVIYKQLDYSKFTNGLEKTAAEILKLLLDDAYQPDESDKLKAQRLLG